MASHERDIPVRVGHSFQGINIYGKAQLGDVYYDDNPLHYLPYAAEAPFDSFHRQHEPTCLENTRVDLLREICSWANGEDDRNIFWLSGLAGTGKSTIARTIARQYSERRHLGASFFFSRGGGDVSHAGKFVTSIAMQLANNVPPLQHYICEAIRERSDIASKPLRDQWRHLILSPLSKLRNSLYQASYILVVDALDECDDENNIRIILGLLSETRSLKTVRLRTFITSRPEIPIRHGFLDMPDAEYEDFVLHSISPSIIDHDILIFLEYNMRTIAQERALDARWPGEHIIRRLVENASGLFIWAATACRFIREGKRFAARRLAAILDASNTTITAPGKHLHEIYLTILRQSISPGYTDAEKDDLYAMLRHVLGSIVALLSPLSAYSLGRLLYIPKQDIDETLEDLHAILDIPEVETRPLRLHHPSFRDFLLNKDRCDDSNFQVDEKEAHRNLTQECIRLMSASLKQDICALDAPGVLVTDIDHGRVGNYISPEVQYACVYWVQHFQKSDTQLYDNDQVHQFLQVHLLHWLEALSWIRKTLEGITAISSLYSVALASGCPHLYAFLLDVKRFLIYNHVAIESSPLQLYGSALIFAPRTSIVRKQFEDRIPRWIQKSLDVLMDWSTILHRLKATRPWVQAVAFSPDGRLLASASRDHTVGLWDVGSGTSLHTLGGHTNWVHVVVFSPDGRLLISASRDNAIKIWDTDSGASLHTLEGHNDLVIVVIFSPDGKLLASGSCDNTIRLWDAGLGVLLYTLEGHIDWVFDLAFSPDSKLLASGSCDNTIGLWDPGSGALLYKLEEHNNWVADLAFSPDGKLLASASFDNTIRLWDAGSGAPIHTLEGHNDWVQVVAFSPDGKLLASSSRDNTARLWDADSGALLHTLEGHSDWVLAIVFSPDGKLLASSSRDNTLRLWNIGSRSLLHTLKGHKSSVYAVAFSPDGKLLASASVDSTVKLWETSTGAALQTLEGHSTLINAVAFSLDGKLLASASRDHTVKLWDAGSGAVLQTHYGHSDWINAVTFSPDGKLLASASVDGTVKLWEVGTGATLQTLKAHSDSVKAVSFSPDGKLLVTASADSTVKLWDACIGVALHTLEGHSDSVNDVAFSPDGKLLASSSNDKAVKLWDVSSGATLQTIDINAAIQNLSFSDDGASLDTGRELLSIPFLPSSVVLSKQNRSRSIIVQEEWVTWEGKNMLWLPLAHRVECAAVHGNVVAIGSASGFLSIIKFGF